MSVRLGLSPDGVRLPSGRCWPVVAHFGSTPSEAISLPSREPTTVDQRGPFFPLVSDQPVPERFHRLADQYPIPLFEFVDSEPGDCRRTHSRRSRATDREGTVSRSAWNGGR